MVGMVVVVLQLVLNNPGRRYEAEAADSHQSGGEEHPEATHTAEHGGSSGHKARGETQIDPEPDFFFLFPAQERMHLELTPSRAGLQLGQVRQGCAVCVQSIWKFCKRTSKTHQQGESKLKSYALFLSSTAAKRNARIIRRKKKTSGSLDLGEECQGRWRLGESCGHKHVPEPLPPPLLL